MIHVAIAALSLALSASSGPSCLTDLQRLGRHVFFDESLSEPPGQSCASCHGPQAGFAGPHSLVNATTAVYEGAVAGRFGNRKPPSAAYAPMILPLRSVAPPRRERDRVTCRDEQDEPHEGDPVDSRSSIGVLRARPCAAQRAPSSARQVVRIGSRVCTERNALTFAAGPTCRSSMRHVVCCGCSSRRALRRNRKGDESWEADC